MAQQYCERTGKIIYSQRDVAVAVTKANSRTNFKHSVREQHSYHCEHCSNWHMTSAPRNKTVYKFKGGR